VAGKTPAQIAAIALSLKGMIVLTQPEVTDFIRADRPQPSDPRYVPNSAAYATDSRVPSLTAAAPPTPAQQLTGERGALQHDPAAACTEH
jgi:hypothetical protein